MSVRGRSRLFWAVLAVLLAVVPAALAEDPVSIAVMDFEDAKLNNWWGWDWNVGQQFTVLVTDALLEKDKFQIMERSRLEEIMAEQNLQMSGAVDESTAVQIGKLLGVRLMVLGSVTEFQMTGASGLSIGGFGLGLQKASVKLSARLVDVQTGQILASSKGEGSASGASISGSLSGVGFNTEKFRSTTLGKASVKAVESLTKDLVGKIESSIDKVQSAQAVTKLSGKVAAVLSPAQVVIDLGSKKGVRKGQTFNVFRLQTVPGLSQPVRVPVGVIKVSSVDPEAAVASVTQTESEIQAGDAIEAL